MTEDNQKEWYYTNGEKREGPISFKKVSMQYKSVTGYRIICVCKV